MERYLIVYGRTEAGDTRFQLRVCSESQWLQIYRWYGWYIVATDPDPNRAVPRPSEAD